MQLTFGDAEGQGPRMQTRREHFIAEMDRLVPRKRLLALFEPHYPKTGRRGRQPYPLLTMRRVDLLQQWYGPGDPSMEEALYDTAVMLRFAGINGLARIPNDTTILSFRRLLETHALAAEILNSVNAHLQRKGMSLRVGKIVDATITHASSSSKNADKVPDLDMHQARKGNQWYLGMKAHIEVDDLSGLVRHAECTAVICRPYPRRRDRREPRRATPLPGNRGTVSAIIPVTHAAATSHLPSKCRRRRCRRPSSFTDTVGSL